MNYPLTGYHHITACAGGAQEDVDFFTGVVGLRMVKQTVLMDGSIPIYHLYYSNASIDPGSVMTTFPYSRKPGRRGSGQVYDRVYGEEGHSSVLAGSPLATQSGAKRAEIKDRFYFHSMYCRCPGGILVESCCNVPGGFEKDETKQQLGTKLHVPPWFENRRDEIVASLESIRVPETATAPIV